MSKKPLGALDTLNQMISEAISFSEDVESFCDTFGSLTKNEKYLRKQSSDIVKSLKKEVNTVKSNVRKQGKESK